MPYEGFCVAVAPLEPLPADVQEQSGTGKSWELPPLLEPRAWEGTSLSCLGPSAACDCSPEMLSFPNLSIREEILYFSCVYLAVSLP